MSSLKVDSDNLHKLFNVRRLDGEAFTDPTAVAIICLTSDNAETPLTDSDITMTAVDSSNEKFIGTFPHTVTLVDGTSYTTKTIITDGGDGAQRTIRQVIVASSS